MVKLLRGNKPPLALTENKAANRHIGAHPAIPRFIRLFSIPILLFWVGLVVVLSVTVSEPGLACVATQFGQGDWPVTTVYSAEGFPLLTWQRTLN